MASSGTISTVKTTTHSDGTDTAAEVDYTSQLNMVVDGDKIVSTDTENQIQVSQNSAANGNPHIYLGDDVVPGTSTLSIAINSDSSVNNIISGDTILNSLEKRDLVDGRNNSNAQDGNSEEFKLNRPNRTDGDATRNDASLSEYFGSNAEQDNTQIHLPQSADVNKPIERSSIPRDVQKSIASSSASTIVYDTVKTSPDTLTSSTSRSSGGNNTVVTSTIDSMVLSVQNDNFSLQPKTHQTSGNGSGCSTVPEENLSEIDLSQEKEGKHRTKSFDNHAVTLEKKKDNQKRTQSLTIHDENSPSETSDKSNALNEHGKSGKTEESNTAAVLPVENSTDTKSKAVKEKSGAALTIPTVQEHLYKILVIGEFGVGKTSIIRRYTEGYFSPNYKLTIGVDFALKSLSWDAENKVNLQLWDIAGHERFGHMTRVYYKYAIAAIIVFDLSRPATFDAIIKWLEDLHSKVSLPNNSPIPVLLLANKCDLADVRVDREMLNTFCQQNEISGWFPTSAKDDINIEEALRFLVRKVLALTVPGIKSKNLLDTSSNYLHLENSVDVAMEPDSGRMSKMCSGCNA